MKVKYWRNGENQEIEGRLLNFLDCIEGKVKSADSPEYWLTFLEGPRAGMTIGVLVAPIVRADNGWIV